MFEGVRLEGTSPRSIIVQTRKGVNLDNFIGPEPSDQCRSGFELLCNKFGKSWILRREPTGGYNCAGLVWATRRSALPEPSDWERILEEDGYREIATEEHPKVGDVVVYRHEGNREILHVARLCQMDHLSFAGSQGDNSSPIFAALSKWSLTYGESIHRINDVFLNGGEKFQSLIYTDRESAAAYK